MIIYKSLNEVLPLIFPLYISQRLIIMPHMQTEVPLVLFGEVNKRLRVHYVCEEVEALADLLRVVDVG